MDTIFALATPRGKSGVAVIRLSGPLAHPVTQTIAGALPLPRQARLSLLRVEDEVIDQALVLIFSAGASFTGEDVAEWQVHGAAAVIKRLLAWLADQPGLRLAEAGEFTRRALMNNRMDLAEVEGLGDLIDAETEAQRRQAQRLFSGEMGQKVDSWRDKLIRAAALVEATIDFADEDVPVDVTPEVTSLLDQLIADLSAEVSGSHVAERLRDGFEVAIVGAPNVGKSTLLNRLAGREAAITSETAGTTRDVIEVRMDLRGIPVTLLDTAGLRETIDHVEGIGVQRALDRAASADLRVILTDSGPPDGLMVGPEDIILAPKADLTGHGISGLSGQGVDALVDRIADLLEKRVSLAGLVSHERHRVALTTAQAALERARTGLGTAGQEMVAEDIREALRALDSLVGRIDVETVLGAIFASFCIGK